MQCAKCAARNLLIDIHETRIFQRVSLFLWAVKRAAKILLINIRETRILFVVKTCSQLLYIYDHYCSFDILVHYIFVRRTLIPISCLLLSKPSLRLTSHCL